MKKILACLVAIALTISGFPTLAQGVGPVVGPGAPSTSSVPTILGQSGVPFIMVGSGSMANNGALTLTTPLAANPAITNAYVFLPAGAVASGVPAAGTWYYALFSSTSAATVFNNTYTSGTPTVPVSPTAFATTGPGAYAGTSGQTTAYSLTISGNLLGATGALEVPAAFSYTNSASNKTLAITYGALILVSTVATTTVSQAGIWGFRNQGVTNAQMTTVPNATNAPFDGGTSAIAAGSVDTTSAQTLAIKMTNATPASNNLALINAAVQLLPGVP